MKRAPLVLGVAFASLVSGLAHGHGGMQERERGSSSSADRREVRPMEEPRFFAGEVRGIDRDAGRVILKHEAISVLDVPANTTAYPVKDLSILDRINMGDRVRFTAVLQGRALITTKILPRD